MLDGLVEQGLVRSQDHRDAVSLARHVEPGGVDAAKHLERQARALVAFAETALNR